MCWCIDGVLIVSDVAVVVSDDCGIFSLSPKRGALYDMAVHIYGVEWYGMALDEKRRKRSRLGLHKERGRWGLYLEISMV